MPKTVLILSSSPRRGGNSDLLCDEFLRGAADAGHTVRKVFLRDLTIGCCTACYACRTTGACALRDDMPALLDAMLAADVLVLASPVYFYSISAQLKAVIDRTLARWTQLKNKELYYILTAAEDTDTVMDVSLGCLRGFADCLEGSAERGVLLAKGVYAPGDVRSTPYPAQARQMGAQV